MAATRNTPPSVNLNLNVRGLLQSATLRINEQSNQLLRDGMRVFKLGLGQSPFPVPTAVVNQLRVNAHQKDYLPVMGLRELRGAVSNYYVRTQNVRFTPENVMIGPGSKELMFILQLVYYGDLVIPTPSWVSYAPQAHIVGRHIRWLETSLENNWRITPDLVERLCSKDPDRPRLLILNYPSNPTGTTYRSDELRALAQVARRYHLVLLSDEIYGELHHNGRHVSVARYYPEGTIISSGLSKWCGAGGWRLGTFAFPESLSWLKESMAVVASETYTSTSTPIQHAAVRAFDGDLELEDYLFHARRILRRLGKILAARLREAGISVADAQGGFYLFPDFTSHREALAGRGATTSEELCQLLLQETGVATLPGSAFGRDPEELTLRIAYVDFDGTRALIASRETPTQKRLDDGFLDAYCENCLIAVDRIGAWLHR
jgi:aspartate aminotransferase